MAGIKNCPDCCFMGDIDDDKVYPFGVLTEEESDQKYAKKEYEQKVDKNTADIKNLGTSTAVEFTNAYEKISEKADAGNVYSKEEVDEKLENVKVDVYTKSESDGKFATKEELTDVAEHTAQFVEDLENSKADKTEVNSLATDKADKSELIALATDKADKTEVEELANVVNTKASKTSLQELAENVETKADKIALYELESEISSKADKATTTDLQNQIDSFDHTPEVDEVVNARNASDGNSYPNLKSRLDKQHEGLKQDLSESVEKIVSSSLNLYVDGYTEKENGYLGSAEATVLTPSSQYVCLKVKVDENTAYTATHIRHYMGFFAADGTKTGWDGQNGKDLYNYTFTTPANTSYAWIIVPSSESLKNYMVVKGESMPEDYIEGTIALQSYIRSNATTTPIFNLQSGAYVKYDVVARTITFPQCTIMYGNKAAGFTAATIDLSEIATENNCWTLLYNYNTGKIEAVKWKATYNYPVIGVVYNNKLFINGLLESQIKLENASTSAPYNPTAYIALNDNQYIVYNYSTKVLTIPSPAFTIINNAGVGRATTYELDLTNILVSGACLLWQGADGIYASDWRGSKQTNMTDNLIGYVYKTNVCIIGVPSEKIIVKSDTCCFFGDSITAGVNTTKLYHMYWAEWNGLICKNYGIGGIGFCKSYSGASVTGNGNEGIGTSVMQEGNNTIIDVMKTASAINKCVIFAGTNDWGSHQPLDKFKSAVGEVLDYALSKTAYIMVITPVARAGYKANTNNLGKKLADYSAIIKEECENRGICCVDGFSVCLNPDNAKYKTEFIPDGLHPNASGHKMLARKLYNDFLVSMCR